MREFLARERAASYALLVVSLLVTVIPLAVPTAMILYVVGVEQGFHSQEEFQISDVPQLAVTLAVAALIAYGRAFARTADAVTWARVRVQGCLMAVECLGAGLVQAVTGEDLITSALSGAALSQLITGLIVGKWMHDLPRPASTAPPPAPPHKRSGPASARHPRAPRTPEARVPESVPPAPGIFARPAPAPGQIWFARVPYDDDSGWKDRPCLVVCTLRRHALVLKITSKDKRGRAEYVRMPVAPWDQHAVDDSWLELSPLRDVPYSDFRRPAGPCDVAVWQRVAGRHGVRERNGS